MKNTLIQDINNYVTYLNEIGLSVSIHGKAVSGMIEHNIHTNPFCAFVKANEEALKKCVRCQQKVLAAYNGDMLFGMCHAGVEEYVFYATPRCFISVSGYGIDNCKAAERITRLTDEYTISKTELINIYERGLKKQKEDIKRLKTLIKPLCHMLSLLELTLGDVTAIQSKSKNFDAILSFIQKNIMQDIKILDIADACCCSESTVSHLFKENMGMSLKKYLLTERLKRAEKLISTSDLPIGSIASLCGFSDTNYFSTAFKKFTGKNPTQYRKKLGG